MQWTYNSGLMLAVYGELYDITGNLTFIKLGKQVALHSLKIYSHDWTCISEDTDLDADAELFKGVYVQYLGEFAVRLIRLNAKPYRKIWKAILKMLVKVYSTVDEIGRASCTVE